MTMDDPDRALAPGSMAGTSTSSSTSVILTGEEETVTTAGMTSSFVDPIDSALDRLDSKNNQIVYDTIVEVKKQKKTSYIPNLKIFLNLVLLLNKKR